MTQSICFKCGAEKISPFNRCPRCAAKPSSVGELEISIALSEYIHSKDKLTDFAYIIEGGGDLIIAPEKIQQAREAIQDKQLMSLLKLVKDDNPENEEDEEASIEFEQAGEQIPIPPPKTNKNTQSSGASIRIRKDAPTKTVLHQNPFYLLGVTTRDNSQRIVEAAEEKSLILDEALCTKAQSDLTHPKNRLSVEISWLPGISPKRASDLINLLEDDPGAIMNQSNIPPLSLANLVAASFERIAPETDAMAWGDWIDLLAKTVDEIDLNDIFRDINEDRAISGISKVTSIGDIEAAVTRRKRYYTDAIKNAMNRLPSKKLVKVVTDVVESATEDGEIHAYALIDEIVDSYEIEAQSFLNQEAENINQLAEATRLAASRGLRDNIPPLLDKIDKTVRNWDAVAQPIQVSKKSCGLDHKMSTDLAHTIRDLGINLFNEHNMLEAAQQITETLQVVFAELPEVVDRLEEDVSAIEGIVFDRAEAKREEERHAEEITYKTEIGGVLVKKTLAISPQGVQWKNTTIPLDQITRVRWGATRHTVNGIPTGTTHTIYFGDNRRLMHVETREEAVYHEFIDKLWKAVCVRLWIEMLQGLKEGKRYRFGDAMVDDKGVVITKSGFFSSGEKIYGRWDQIQTWSANGNFVIGIKGDKKASSAISYQDVDNTHILAAAISAGFKDGADRLSDLLS